MPAPLSAASDDASLDPQQQAVLDHLSHAIQWYRAVEAGDHWIFQPSDEFFWSNQQALANQAVQQAFVWAQADALAMASDSPAKDGKAASTEAERKLAARGEATSAEVRSLQGRIADLNEQMRTAAPGAVAALTAQRDALQGELDLETAYQDSIEKFGSLLSSSDEVGGTASLTARINALKRSLPQAFTSTQASQGTKPAAVAAVPNGLLQQLFLLFSLTRDRHELAVLGSATGPTAKLRTEAESLVAPLRQQRDRIVQQGHSVSSSIASQGSADLERTRKTLDAFAGQFRQVAAGLLALRQESIAVEQSRDNAREWRTSFDQRYDQVVRQLLVRAVTVVAFLGLLALGSEIWRRATVRYVHDMRRRRQFLIMRRFTTGVLMAIVVILGLVSNFGSLATYAGLITAGIAVALQSVILCFAGYFFLLGRYGIRVGDRVTVAGVTGDVIDVGPVRFYMRELAASTGIMLQPTGRLIVLPNSVLFSNSPLYKQIPGTAYAWHAVAVVLAPGADQAKVEAKLLEAVDAVYSEYRPSLERQHSSAERLIDLQLELPKPTANLGFTDSGLELVVRYPVDLHQMAEMDQAISHGVQKAIAADPALQAAITGTAHIRAAVKT